MNFAVNPTSTTPPGLRGLSCAFFVRPQRPAAREQGAVNHRAVPIRIACQRGQQPLPHLSGSKRPCAPLRPIHNTASTKRRHAASCPPSAFGSALKKSRLVVHWSSDSLTVDIRPVYIKCQQNLIANSQKPLGGSMSSFFRRLERAEAAIERQIIDNFESPCQKERPAQQRRRKELAGKLLRQGRADAAHTRGDSGGG